MGWSLNFISEEDFKKHVGATIEKYGENHQRIFQYIDKCRVPENGKEGGWDVIYQNEDGIILPDGDIVHTVYVEMKNKHNTMNSASAGKTYIKMQHQLLSDDDCACFLVEAIAQKSQNITWKTTVDGKRVSHKRIRRVSLDQFYAITTGEENAFYNMCMALPNVIENVVKHDGTVQIPHDVVLQELKNIALISGKETEDMAMAIAVYMLGFSSYLGFSSLIENTIDHAANDNNLKRIYAYATHKLP